MKLRVQNDRTDSRRVLKLRESPTVMQPNSTERGGHAGNGLSLTLQPELFTRAPVGGAAASSPESSEVRVPMTGGPGESSGGASSRRCRINSHSHSHSHAHNRAPPSSSEPELDPPDPDLDSGEPSASLSELRCLFRWLQKSLPFLVILCAKLVIQHALGLAVGIGLFTTFLYVNKNIQTQVFLQDRHSKLQCIWLLLFLISCTLLLYYTFLTETLYHCLILLSPTIERLGFWETLWAVGVTNFVIKFLCMGIKCLILLLPSSLVSYRTQGRWLMLTEELGQVHQTIAPVPLWFRYLVTYQETEGTPGLTLGVLLALLYLILKLLGLYGQWTSLMKTGRLFLRVECTGTAATRSQCNEAGDVCPICQGEYREPRALLCQHIFCDECIAMWFNREKSCPLCRTVITEKVYKWRDGATSPHLQIY
ncbi:E3 ubiquitin-protein ligase RNFT1 [Pundamilia nyererei]|uniref:E3 ubiquitin-protein ligase RNFT1 n=1 Tax=Pundamilia nyererei TaxID=303518 RepID=A0A3B4H785_9CICH|nr:PREDICTED: RING finger and transmembrane domain-containing protein 1 [Pundamilia nyererei]XP_013768186.1 PREDICTED: RING finger and transmembrane domain-containing protein 1 [Pundamilia nyererei]